MPRLSKELVAARESFATQAAKEGKTAEQIQALLVEVGPGGKTGMRMFVPRLEQLIKESTGGLPSTIKPAPVPTPKVIEKTQDGRTGMAVKDKSQVCHIPTATRVEKCAVDYGGKDCGNEVTVIEGRDMGKNLPVCSKCRASGVMAVIRRVA